MAFKKHWDKILLAIFILTYIALLGSLSILRHNSFYSRFDLTNMDQTVYYALNGHFFSFRLHDDLVSRFSVHSDIILLLLSPLYLIKDDVRLLLFVATVGLALGAIPTYFLSLRVIKNKVISLAIAFIYLANPTMQWTNIYDFHGVSFAIPFLISAFYFAYIKQWKWYWLFVGLSLITKEQISLNIAMLGLFVFFVFKKRFIGAATIIIGLSWFILMVHFIMPYFTPKGEHWALQEFGQTGVLPIAENFLHPSVFFSTFFNKNTIEYSMLLIRPFSFIPLIGFPWLFLSAPDIAINIIRNTTSIQFHYDSGTTPALVIATIFGFSYLIKFLQKIRFIKRYTFLLLYLLTTFFVLYGLRTNYHYGPLPWTPSCWCSMYQNSQEDQAFEKILQTIPKEAVVTSSLEIQPHLNHREYSYALPSATDSADFIAALKENRIVGNNEKKEYENELIPQLLNSSDHEILFKGEHLYLFKKLK